MFNEVYDSDGELGPFYDLKYLEYTQDFDKYALSDVFPFYAGEIILIIKIMHLLCKEGISQITIHPLQYILTFQNINSKRGMLIS